MQTPPGRHGASTRDGTGVGMGCSGTEPVEVKGRVSTSEGADRAAGDMWRWIIVARAPTRWGVAIRSMVERRHKASRLKSKAVVEAAARSCGAYRRLPRDRLLESTRGAGQDASAAWHVTFQREIAREHASELK